MSFLFSASAPIEPIPDQMKRLVLVERGNGKDMTKSRMEVVTVDTPKPKNGEVLVKMAAAPVNPSDYGEWLRGKPEDLPKPVGKEGSGVVVASGGGFMTNGLLGKKVGVVVQDPKQGTYSEYVTVSATQGAFPLPADLPVEAAASFFVNPYTAVGIVETAKSVSAGGFVHTAGASQLGQMMTKLCAKQGYTLVSVVRRQEQAKLLKDLGAEHVVVTGEGNEDKWQAELGAIIKELKIKCAFECISGDTTGQILSLLPKKGHLYLYGALSLSPPGLVDPMDLIYFAKKLEGWLLTRWLMAGGTIALLRRIRATSATVNEGLGDGGWCESKFVDTTFDAMWPKFLEMWSGSVTNTKLRIRIGNAE